MFFWILICIAISLLLIDEIKIPRKKKGVKVKIDFKINFEKQIEKYPEIKKIIKSYVDKLLIINQKNIKENENIATGIMLGIISISTFVTILFFLLGIKIWYVLFILEFVSIYFVHSIANFYLSKKVSKVYIQFPIAIQTFTDMYITTNNIKSSLDESCREIPSEISNVFQKLSRELSSSYNYEQKIRDFANSLKYTWGYAFAELLLLSYQGGDISSELIYLNELINDDIKDKEESNSELAANKLMFIMINIVTFIAFLMNTLYNPIAKKIYFYTIQGNNLIMLWVLEIALGLIVLKLVEKT